MAITQSAKKAIRQSAKRKEQNIVYKNKIKVLVKEARALVSAKKLRKLCLTLFKSLAIKCWVISWQ